MRDVFPQQAKLRWQVESRLVRLFDAQKFELVSCGTFEYVDTLLRGRAEEESRDWVRLLDSSGRMMALRPEMTPSIARMAAPLLAAGMPEVRWCYGERVYRRTDDPASLSWASGRAAESTQVGIEWIGGSGDAVDAQVVSLCQSGLQELHLAEWQMVVSHAAFAPEFFQALELPKETIQDLLRDLSRGDYVNFRSLATASGIHQDLLQVLADLNPLHAGSLPLWLTERWQQTEAGHRVQTVWNKLVDFGQVLQQKNLANHLAFDLTLVRDVSYYTGIVFEVFAPGAGAPVALGGRYDDLLGQFGAPAPAVGFAYEVERLLTALTAGEWLAESDQNGGV
ncbi:ATP phosphoribosyltransferase regulatory subunit [Alicyclobacillaceae bacterium I2511]|nr:ATP phosphoribosyltransferase regulatory subunit [Alicyclobacillaceae bacterium I2511]